MVVSRKISLHYSQKFMQFTWMTIQQPKPWHIRYRHYQQPKVWAWSHHEKELWSCFLDCKECFKSAQDKQVLTLATSKYSNRAPQPESKWMHCRPSSPRVGVEVTPRWMKDFHFTSGRGYSKMCETKNTHSCHHKHLNAMLQLEVQWTCQSHCWLYGGLEPR